MNNSSEINLEPCTYSIDQISCFDYGVCNEETNECDCYPAFVPPYCELTVQEIAGGEVAFYLMLFQKKYFQRNSKRSNIFYCLLWIFAAILTRFMGFVLELYDRRYTGAYDYIYWGLYYFFFTFTGASIGYLIFSWAKVVSKIKSTPWGSRTIQHGFFIFVLFTIIVTLLPLTIELTGIPLEVALFLWYIGIAIEIGGFSIGFLFSGVPIILYLRKLLLANEFASDNIDIKNAKKQKKEKILVLTTYVLIATVIYILGTLIIILGIIFPIGTTPWLWFVFNRIGAACLEFASNSSVVLFLRKFLKDDSQNDSKTSQDTTLR